MFIFCVQCSTQLSEVSLSSVSSSSLVTNCSSPFSEISFTPGDSNSYEFTQPEGDAIIDASAEIISYTAVKETILLSAVQEMIH